MDIERNLESLEQLLNEQIGKVVKKDDITPNELEAMTKAVCLLEKIKDYSEDMMYIDEDKGYSQADGRRSMGYSRRNSRYSRRPMYEDSDPYMMPHSNRSYSNRGYSRRSGMYSRDYDHSNYGYSGHSIKDRMIDKLEQMYDEAKTDHERQIVDEWINRLTSE